MAEILKFEADIVLPIRNNPDVTVNDFGLKVLNLCKSNSLRSLNGRSRFQSLLFLYFIT